MCFTWKHMVSLQWRHYENDAVSNDRRLRRLFAQPFVQAQIEIKHQSSASLAFVRGIHRWPVNSRTKGQLRGKCFHLMTSPCLLAKFPWCLQMVLLWLWNSVKCPADWFTVGNHMIFRLHASSLVSFRIQIHPTLLSIGHVNASPITGHLWAESAVDSPHRGPVMRRFCVLFGASRPFSEQSRSPKDGLV